MTNISEKNENITVGQLINLIDPDFTGDGTERIQVCIQDGEWEDYDEIGIYSSFIDAISNCKVKEIGAICKNVFRIDIDWSEFNKGEQND